MFKAFLQYAYRLLDAAGDAAAVEDIILQAAMDHALRVPDYAALTDVAGPASDGDIGPLAAYIWVALQMQQEEDEGGNTDA